MQTVTRARYAKDITFEDPITKYSDIDGMSLISCFSYHPTLTIPCPHCMHAAIRLPSLFPQ